MKNNILPQKSFQFALRIVALCRYLNDRKHEYVLSKHLLNDGTSIGSYVEEAQQAYGKPDFVQLMAIANKRSFKTNYWLRLLHQGGLLSDEQFESIMNDCIELQKILSSVVRTTRSAI